MNKVLGIVRNWIQWNAKNGSTVTWGTDQILKFNRPLTVMDLEEFAVEIEEKLKSSNSDYAKCKSIGCQFYDEKMEFNCCANENLCEKCINSQHLA